MRFSTEKYELGDLHNKFMHLTNSSINKYSPLLHKVKQTIGTGAKWNFAMLRSYFKVRESEKLGARSG